MLQLNNASNTELLKYISYTFGIGFATYLLIKTLKSKYVYPPKINNNKKFGSSKSEIIKNLQDDHEKFLLMLKQVYPDECMLDLNEGLFETQNKRIIILNSIEAIKRFAKDSSSDFISNRPKNFVLNLLSKSYLGSFFRMNDDKLKEIRKSSLQGLHKLIGANNELDTKLIEELQHFFDFVNEFFIENNHDKASLASKYSLSLNEHTGLIENAPVYFQQYCANLIVQLGLGIRFQYETKPDTAIKQQMSNMSDLLNSLNMIQLDDFKEQDAQTQTETMNFLGSRLNPIYEFLTNAVVGYKSNYDPDVLQTFADYVISKQIEKLKSQGSLDDSDNYSDKDIIVQVFTLFMAGVATTGFTTSWAFHYLAKNKDVQTKIYDEIVSVAGTSALVNSTQRASLPYTEAAINELLRLSSTQSLIPRATQNEAQIGAYRIPENTTG